MHIIKHTTISSVLFQQRKKEKTTDMVGGNNKTPGKKNKVGLAKKILKSSSVKSGTRLINKKLNTTKYSWTNKKLQGFDDLAEEALKTKIVIPSKSGSTSGTGKSSLQPFDKIPSKAMVSGVGSSSKKKQIKQGKKKLI
ncbi:unnamed protein product [Lathyrus oleraceus]